MLASNLLSLLFGLCSGLGVHETLPILSFSSWFNLILSGVSVYSPDAIAAELRFSLIPVITISLSYTSCFNWRTTPLDTSLEGLHRFPEILIFPREIALLARARDL